jgi:hypothetical protein
MRMPPSKLVVAITSFSVVCYAISTVWKECESLSHYLGAAVQCATSLNITLLSECVSQ